MKAGNGPWRNAAGALALLVLTACGRGDAPVPDPVWEEEDVLPVFEVDTDWPRLPENWIMASGLGLFVDSRDNVWVSHRAELIRDEDLAAVPDGVPAPLVMEIDRYGNLVQGWGYPHEAEALPAVLHGLFVDHTDHIWSNARDQQQIMKFDRWGERVLTIGKLNETGGSNDPERLGRPAGLWVDMRNNELFVADGYTNRRVVVFDAATGEYLRHWGAYGEPPEDGPAGGGRGGAPDAGEGPPRQFSTAHGITGSDDGLLYVADRGNSRIQVFRRDGEFVMERILRPGSGAAFDVALDPEQRFLYVADGTQHKIWILRRSNLEIVGEFGSQGSAPGQFQRPHNLAVDSHGNLYVAEADPGWRVQRFNFERHVFR